MITIRHERPSDVAARETLLDDAFGDEPLRARPSERLREGRLPADGLAFVAAERRPRWSAPSGCGTSRCGSGRRRCCSARSRSHPACRNRGIGAALVRRALREARRLGHRAVLLVGDAALLRPLRLLGREDRRACGCPVRSSGIACSRSNSSPGALDGARGAVAAAGSRKPALAAGGGGSRHRSCPAPHRPAINTNRGRRAEIRAAAYSVRSRSGGYHPSHSWRDR